MVDQDRGGLVVRPPRTGDVYDYDVAVTFLAIVVWGCGLLGYQGQPSRFCGYRHAVLSYGGSVYSLEKHCFKFRFHAGAPLCRGHAASGAFYCFLDFSVLSYNPYVV